MTSELIGIIGAVVVIVITWLVIRNIRPPRD